MFYKLDKSCGGAALEYLIVSVFASALALSLLSFSSSFLKKNLKETFEKLGLEDDGEIFESLKLGE